MGSQSIGVLRTSRRVCIAAMVATMFFSGVAALAEEAAKPVRLTIDFGDGVQKVFAELDWNDKLTVLGALQAASKHPRGIKFTHQGEGESAFVTAIDDQKNEGRGAKNWTYSVNDKRADRSCGAWELRPGDAVLWRYSQ